MKISIIKDITTAVRGDRSYKSRTAGLPTRYVEQPLLSGKVTIEVEADGKAYYYLYSTRGSQRKPYFTRIEGRVGYFLISTEQHLLIK